MAALVIAPAIACWFLLRRGYSTGLRVAAFTYAAVMFALGLFRVFDHYR
jgi:hypothetical protein